MFKRGMVMVVAALLLGPTLALAVDPGGGAIASADQELLKDKVDRLEALVEQQDARIRHQDEKIESLQNRLTAADGAFDEARVDQIKKLVRDVIADSEFRESLFPDQVQVGYDKGFYIRSADEQFLMKINGLLAMRYTYYNDQSRNRWAAPRQRYSDRSGMEVERLRLGFSGHLWGPDLTYRIEVDADTDDEHTWENQYAWVAYRFADELRVMVGLFKVPFGRQETESSTRQMFVDRGMANEVFNLDRSLGVMVYGSLLDKKLDYQVSLTNGWSNANDRFGRSDLVRELDQNPALAARLVYHALGKYGKGESDLSYHEDPAMDVGLSFAYVDDNGDASTPALLYAVPDFFRDGVGGFGVTNTNGTNITQFGADAGFKWRGLAVTGEYWLRIVDVSNGSFGHRLVAPYYVMTGSNETSHYQGAQVQVGYFIIPKKLEAAARVGAVWDVGPGSEGVWEYAAGMNYYFQGHNCKLQADVTKINELPVRSSSANFTDVNDDVTMFRVQLQVAF